MEGKIMSNAQMTALVAKCLGQSLVGEAGGPRSIRLGDLPELFTDCDDDPLTAAAIRSIDGEAALRATVEIIPEDGAIYLRFDAPGDRKSTRLNSRHDCATRMPS